MKKATSKLLLIFFCMSFLMIIPMKANAAENIPVNISVEYGQTEARSILDMINEMRTNRSDAWYWNIDDTTKTTCNNLGELAYDYDLERLAMQRAAEIALSYDHTRPNGDRCFSIYKEKGITYSHAGENIAAGYNSAEAVHMGWREDNDSYAGQGHRRNMLSSKYNCVGIGHVYYNGFHYWVEEFAYRSSVNTTKTTANDSKQTATVSVAKSNIKKLTVSFDEDLSTLRIGETVTPDITAIIDVTNHWGGKGIVADLPTISLKDSSIATYSNGTISGIAEGTTTLTASLYGLTAANTPTVSVHSCDNHWDNGKITTKPTCIKTGEQTFTCTICHNTKTEPVLTTDNHLNTEIRNQKEPTCKEEGYTGDTYCSDCKTLISSGQSIAKTENHNWDDGKITTKPTCTKKGEKTFTCSICGGTKTTKINATGHKHTEIRNKKSATCKEEGYTGDTCCSDCGTIISPGKSIAKTKNHKWDDGKITTEPTCTKKGEKTFTCSICGNTKATTITAMGHKHTEIRNQKVATCKEAGYTGDTYCSDCGAKISSGQSIAKTRNHNWDDGKITTEPTCTKKGEKTFTCSICGGTKTTKINATGHSYGEYVIVKAPTNSEKGLKSKTCSTCGKVYSVTIPKVNSVTAPKEDSSETNTEQNIQTSQQTTKKIKLNRRKLTLKKGKTFKLKVTLTPKNSQDKIIYKTSNKKVAKVSKSGKIKAVKKGKANITVISGKKKIVCKVIVK